MSTSPLPSDPYECLGISKDAEPEEVKKAHRKLALKHHPDRIKDPSLIEQNKNEFQRIQQAYELLIDPSRRQRYDDECKLAQLRRERMMSEPPRPSYMRPSEMRSSPAASPTHNPMPRDMPRTTQREMPQYRPEPQYKSEPRYEYEDRVPDSYFDFNNSRDRFEEPVSRASARKSETYERRSSVQSSHTHTQKPAEKKERPKASGWERTASGMPLKYAFHMKEKAEKAREKTKEREIHAKASKNRDREEQRARSEKEYSNSRYAARVEDLSEEDGSESDTVVATPRQPLKREASSSTTSKPKRPVTPEHTPLRRHLSPHRGPVYDAEPDRYDQDSAEEKWERHHRMSKEYQNESRKRPPLSRNGSDIHSYWAAADVPRDAGREPSRDTPRDMPRDVPRDMPRDLPRDMPRESTRDSAREYPRDSVRDRRSGSDSDRYAPESTKSTRRSVQEEPRIRPTLGREASAPVGSKSSGSTMDRENPTRSRNNSYNAASALRKEVPGLKRAGSDPVKSDSKRESAPSKSSNLKQSETPQDSGYGSSSSPHTPEMRGDSPPHETKSDPRPRETATRYKVQKDEFNDEVRRARKIMADNDCDPMSMPQLRKFLSPEDAISERREREHHGHHHSTSEERRERRSSRSRDPESRSRSNRPGESSERRPSISREASSSRYEERPRRLYKEMSPDRSYSRKVDPASVKTSHRNAPKYSNYEDYYSNAGMHRSVRETRRPSVGMV